MIATQIDWARLPELKLDFVQQIVSGEAIATLMHEGAIVGFLVARAIAVVLTDKQSRLYCHLLAQCHQRSPLVD